MTGMKWKKEIAVIGKYPDSNGENKKDDAGPKKGELRLGGFKGLYRKIVEKFAEGKEAGSRKAKRILIVDDEPALVKMLRMRLKHEQFEIIEAYDGEEGLKKAKDVVPDLIVLDVMMPGLSGYEVCMSIKGDEKTKHIPIIMLSARCSEVDAQRGLDCGVDEYFSKPIDSKALIERIKVLLGEPSGNVNLENRGKL